MVTAGLRLTVLGCSGSYPGPGAATSGFLLTAGDTHVWLDAGSGTLANLQRTIGLHDVSAVVVTHEHPDHRSDLEGFYIGAKFGSPPREGVPVYGPAGVFEHSYHADMAPTFDPHVVTELDRVSVGPLSLAFSRTEHGPETLAVRVEAAGRVLAYSADTGPGWSLSALGTGIDLALVESTFLSDQEGDVPGHLSARQAGVAARAAGAGRLVLTHLWPGLDRSRAEAEAAAAFGGDVVVASEGDVFDV